MASYTAVHIENLVAIVDSDGLAPYEPHLEPTDEEDEVGQPQREKEKQLEDVVANEIVPEPVPTQLLWLYGEIARRPVSHSG